MSTVEIWTTIDTGLEKELKSVTADLGFCLQILLSFLTYASPALVHVLADDNRLCRCSKILV